MTRRHVYMGARNDGLTVGQQGTLWDDLRAQLVEDHVRPLKPHRVMTVRFNLKPNGPGREAIFETLVDDGKLTVAAFKSRLATLFGVSAGDIDTDVNNVTFFVRPTPVVTFSYQGADKVTFAVFGGVDAGKLASGLEAVAYVARNPLDWNEPDDY